MCECSIRVLTIHLIKPALVMSDIDILAYVTENPPWWNILYFEKYHFEIFKPFLFVDAQL